jgi:hypothetical protein
VRVEVRELPGTKLTATSGRQAVTVAELYEQRCRGTQPLDLALLLHALENRADPLCWQVDLQGEEWYMHLGTEPALVEAVVFDVGGRSEQMSLRLRPGAFGERRVATAATKSKSFRAHASVIHADDPESIMAVSVQPAAKPKEPMELRMYRLPRLDEIPDWVP